jgi:hypothetical protein
MKYIMGIVLGLIIGLPQGIHPMKKPFEVESLPHETVYIMIAFGTIGGVLMGLALLHKSVKPLGGLFKYLSEYIDFYSLMTVCTLSIGIPIIAKVGISNYYASALLNGYFFSCVGVGLVLAGLVLALLVWKFVFSISMPEKFLPQLPYNERSQSSQGLGNPLQAAFNKVTCFRSCHPSIRRMWI